MKLPCCSTWRFVSALLNPLGAGSLAGIQMTSVKVTRREIHTAVMVKLELLCCPGKQMESLSE